MKQYNTRAMVEVGLLTSFVVILSILNQILPFFRVVGHFLWPVPIAVLGYRHGLRWSVWATILAFILLSFFIGPLTALVSTMTYGAVGIWIGLSYRKSMGIVLRTVPPALMLIGSSMLQLLVLTWVSNIDLLSLGTRIYDESLNGAMEHYAQAGYSEEMLATYKAEAVRILDLLKNHLPVILLGSGMVFSFLDSTLVGILLRRLGEDIRPFPPARQWEMPEWTAYAFVLSWIMEYWGQSREIAWLFVMGTNIKVFSIYLIFIQSFGLFSYFADRHKMSTLTRTTIFSILLFFPIFIGLLVVGGLFDLVTHYRKKRNYDPYDQG